ncbi:hypothetical protein BGX24_001070, partial [Mortierella sp. AD032]
MPLRFAYQPDAITIADTKPSMSPTEMLPESSPTTSTSFRTDQQYSATLHRQLTRQNTAILQMTSASPAEKDKFQQSAALFEDYFKALENGQKKQADLIRSDFQHCFSALQESLDRNHDLQQQLNNMQQRMLQLQQQALDRLAVIQGRIQAILTQTYELHEYPIPRLFIILPKDTSAWNPSNLLNNQFQLYFLCECGEHTKALNGDNTNIPHHIHIAKHEGYDLERPTEFFQKYGRYMLTLLEMIKYGVTITGFAIPALAAVSAPGAIDMFQKSLDSISQSAVNQSIEYLQSISSEQNVADASTDSFAGEEALEGADLRHLEVFIKSKDQDRALGNLYRTITDEGHVKWVCIDHYRLAYKKHDQQAFVTAVELNAGHYDPHLGKVTVRLGSKIQAAGFFDALIKARGVDELVVMFDWEGTTSDLEAFSDTLKSTTVVPGVDGLGKRGLERVVEALKTKSTLTNLKLSNNSIGENGAVVLSEALKTNLTLTILELNNNSIGENGAVMLSEALKTNLTLTTLDLAYNSVGDKGAVALSEALKTNSTLTTLDLRANWIGDNGAVALSEALKINSTLTTLDLQSNSIGNNGATALLV